MLQVNQPARNRMAAKNAKTKNLGGWLIIVLILFVLSFLSAFSLLVEKMLAILFLNIRFGVYISAIFLFYSIVLILQRKKKAYKTSIAALYIGILFSLWYFVIAQLIFYSNFRYFVLNTADFILNTAVLIILILYLKKSKRVKKTLVK